MIKKDDVGYGINILKTIGIAVRPAIVAAIQRAAVKTVEQNSKETHPALSQNFTGHSKENTTSAWDPLYSAQLSTP